MNIEFRFSIGQRVSISDAKREARVVSCIVHKSTDMWYRVLYWHDGDRYVIELHEDELSPIGEQERVGL